MAFSLCLWIMLFPMSAGAESVRYEAEDGRVTFAADVYGSEFIEVAVLNASNMFVADQDEVASIVFGHADYTSGIVYGNPQFTYDSNMLRILQNSDIYFSTKDSDDLVELVNQNDEPYCRGQLPLYEMAFLSQQAAKDAAITLMDSLGLDCQVQAMYSINRTKYNANYDEAVELNKEWTGGDWGVMALPTRAEWPHEDISYVLFLQQQHDGIPLYRYTYQSLGSDLYTSGTNINMSYGRDGLMRLNVSDPVKVVDVAEPPIQILRYDEAAKRFADNRNFILGAFAMDHLVQRISLEYLPTYKTWIDGEKTNVPFTLRPAWVFESVELNTPYPTLYHHLVDAITGDVIGL